MITALFSVLLLAGDAHAAHANPAPAAPAAAEAPKEERKICKRQPISGSQYRTTRLCLTAEQWKARARGEGIEDLGDVNTRTTQ